MARITIQQKELLEGCNSVQEFEAKCAQAYVRGLDLGVSREQLKSKIYNMWYNRERHLKEVKQYREKVAKEEATRAVRVAEAARSKVLIDQMELRNRVSADHTIVGPTLLTIKSKAPIDGRGDAIAGDTDIYCKIHNDILMSNAIQDELLKAQNKTNVLLESIAGQLVETHRLFETIGRK